MLLGVQLGLVASVLCAVCAVLGFLFKHRGAVAVPEVELRRPWRSLRSLLTNRAFLIGAALATTGWGFHVAALALAPISLVQATIAGGLVLLTPLADRVFGLEVGRREWIGVAVVAAGLAVLALSLEGQGDEAHADYVPATFIAYTGALTVLSLLLLPLGRRGPRAGVALGLSGGLMWGASDICIKAVSSELDTAGWLVVLDELSLAILVLSVLGLLVSARSLQLGPAVAVIALTSAAANVTTIASGPLVFGEPFPSDPAGVALRVGAFLAVVVGAALVPGPGAPRDEGPPARRQAEPAPGVA